jgi:copper chaperone NosL
VKVLAVLGALLVVAIAIGVVLWPAPEGPEPIAYGRDVCARCRMQLGRPGFAGELRGADGALQKFDDVGCLLEAVVTAHRETPEAWVEDHRDGTWVPLLAAHFVRTEGVGTPMDHGIVAFRDEQVARAFADADHGGVVRLEELLREPARWAKGTAKTESEALQ